MRSRIRHAALFLLLCSPLLAVAQETPSLRLDSFMVAGGRTNVTEAWGTFEFIVANPSDRDREARVLFFYEGQPTVQYGREIHIPARSKLTSWLLAGPAPADKSDLARSVQMLLYDRSQGRDTLVLPPGEERVRSRVVPYRKRMPHTTMILGSPPVLGDGYGELPSLPTADEDVNHMVRSMRSVNYATPGASGLPERPLPAIPEVFDGVDHLVLASPRLGNDPVGLATVRQWLMQGGVVWVLLDRLGPDALAAVSPLLGDTLNFQIIDRVALSKFRVEPPVVQTEAPIVQEYEEPVELVRVLLPTDEPATHTIDGWPIWFSRSVGRGRVFFTTLESRGWWRDRRPAAPPVLGKFPQPNGKRPAAPRNPEEDKIKEPLEHLRALAARIHASQDEDPIRAEPFRQAVEQEIGYSVVSRSTVAGIFAVLLGTILALGLVLRGPRGRQVLGLAAPALAVIAAGVFVFLGEQTRRAVPLTVAAVQMAETTPGVEDVAVRGMLAVYRPSEGPAEIGATQGGLFDLDQSDATDTRRMFREDLDRWHWEGLSLPRGIRRAAFRQIVRAEEGTAIRASGQITESGLVGKLETRPFRDVSDALLLTPTDRHCAVRLGADGSFRVGPQDVLPPDRFLAGALLSDRQQRRQDLYRQFLKKPPAHLRGRNVILAWAEPIDLHFRLGESPRHAGDALLILPLDLQPATANSKVNLPSALLPYRRIQDVNVRVTREATQGVTQHLRFQIPVAALPMQVESARFTVRLEAPRRTVTVSAREGKAMTEVHRVESPLDAIRVEITRPQLLVPDEEGGLHLTLAISNLPNEQMRAVGPDNKWTIRSIELEVSGRTQQ